MSFSPALMALARVRLEEGKRRGGGEPNIKGVRGVCRVSGEG
jgi:hypothetical protein